MEGKLEIWSCGGAIQGLAAGDFAGLVSDLVAAGLESVLEDLESLGEAAGAESFFAASLYFSLR